MVTKPEKISNTISNKTTENNSKLSNNNTNKDQKINFQNIKKNIQSPRVLEYSSNPNIIKNTFDYTFLSHRNKLITDKHKATAKEYIFDLISNWEINLELIKKQLDNNNKNDFIEILIKNLNIRFSRKNLERQKKIELKAKNLIDRQIMEENKRKSEEVFEFFLEKIKDMDDYLLNKEELIIIIEEKLKEVDIYVHKLIKKNEKYKLGGDEVTAKGRRFEDILA